jgi:uncharacterized repeat protein (TIGR03803 family)
VSKLNWGMRACGILLLWAATAVALPAQTLTTLVTFNGTNGANPWYISLVQGTNGNLYGTTGNGGSHSEGTVFKMSPHGTLTTLYSFCAQTNCSDGAGPSDPLVLANDGNFYGTTEDGGVSLEACNPDRCGTVFKITPRGVLTTLHMFVGSDGYFPEAGLVQGTDGNFYGTTPFGTTGDGTVFKITSGGTFTTLHSFHGTDGASPWAALVQGTDGDFYGTTRSGGAHGEGTVFKITPAGALTTLYSFCAQSNCADGYNPASTLVQGADGSFYGSALDGGISGCDFPYNCGTIFRITPDGKLTTLHRFDATDGASPTGALVQATDGNFYGTTYQGGDLTCGDPNEPFGCGTVFKMTPEGILTTLHNFCVQSGCPDGNRPYAGLVQDTSGMFYGLTFSGGDMNCGGTYYGCGTVFSLDAGLGPFLKTLPAFGAVETGVRILGTDLSSVTNVRFNGIESKFTVVSRSEITTTVPKGATTGPVRVITPTGKLQSNVPFRVTQ